MACLDESTLLDYVRRQLSPERQALWDAGQERKRTRSLLAEAALPGLRQENEKALASEVEAWLASHRVR